MGKTRAEYQREYRERKKLKDKEFLLRERARVKEYRIPINELSKKKKSVVRERNREYSRQYRERCKTKKAVSIEVEEPQSDAVSSRSRVRRVPSLPGPSRQLRRSTSPLLVKLKFACPNRKRTIKRSSLLRKANAACKASMKNAQRWKKKYQRMKALKEAKSTRQHCPSPKATCSSTLQQNPQATPATKTQNDLRESGISPSQIPKSVIKQLTMTNVLLDEIKATVKSNTKQNTMDVIANVVGGKVVKKYKCVSGLHKATGLSKKCLRRPISKVIKLKGRARLVLVRQQLRREVVSFMERDDISVCMPGKSDCKVVNGEKRQTRILNDYLSEVFDKFQVENPEKTISFSCFCKLRPAYILLTSFISRNTCLCNKHQNMAMKLKCLRSLGLQISKSPDSVFSTTTADSMKDLLDNITADQVEYEEWKRVDVGGKKKMKVVKISKNRTDFIDYMQTEYSQFIAHVQRVRGQYAAIHELKETLPKDHLILQMDFAENFACSSMDEIQSAYWNATNVTLHPVVVYYMDEKLEHKNFIFVSDVNQHNSTAVLTILKQLLPELKTTFPDAKYVHYWTDSPSSQYRNRYIFDAVLHHKQLFGLEARWNYFESGHGKGPCDGLGGSCKRQASDAVKQGKAVIQDAQDFYNWAKTLQKSINYRFYSTPDIDQTAQELSQSTASVLPGTMKLHSIFQKDGCLLHREVSCYCVGCLHETMLCENWHRHQVVKRTKRQIR